MKGQAVNNRAVQRWYDRFAMGFPGADYMWRPRVSATRGLAGFPARVAVQSLPEVLELRTLTELFPLQKIVVPVP